MSFFDDIQDMSFDGDTAWQMVTLLVGSERRGFQAHLRRLGPLVAELKLSPGGEVELPEWDADVFNLAMNWMYNTRLPRIKALATHFIDFSWGRLAPNLSRPVADQFVPPEIPGENQTSSYCLNLSAKPEYQLFSIDELRLHFEFAVPDRAIKEGAIAQVIKHQDNEVCENTQHEKKELENGVTPSRSSIPSVIPDDEAVKADRCQTLLLKLMMFAEKYKWEPLFNEAMDAFSYGEAQLRRLYLPASHIDLAFSNPASSAVRRFVRDYAMALGCKNNSMSMYQEAMLSHPEILSWVLARMDLRTPPLNIPNAFTTQPDPARDTYHIHDGSLVARCRCQSSDRLDFGSRNASLLFPNPKDVTSPPKAA
ncbi:hypothetical protein F5B17DRAFT_221152 [Nemania serpens]|nr:hypothetical protein F5B17DRAFT_221152 [Nemania serpens]